MRSPKHYLKYGLLFLLLILATQPFFLSAQDNSDLPEWTFMVYIAADNNLEPFAMRDIAEMEANGSTDEVNIVIQMDRAQGYSREDGDWEGARRYYITQERGLGIGSDVLEDLGDVNMGDAQTLADFGKWAIENYPAQKYALILWDHGGSWIGFAHDESANNDVMTMEELDVALADITTSTGIDKFDLIAFDACLMGGYEVFQTLAPYGNYAIASETLIPGFGFDYDFTLYDLIDNPEMDAVDFGKRIVDNFTLFYDEQSKYKHYSLSLIDLGVMGELEQMILPFGDIIKSNTTSAERITRARNSTIRFGSLSGEFTRDFNSTLGLIDMFEFAENIENFADDADLIASAQQVRNLQDRVVIYHQTSESLVRSRGVSVYFPTNQIRPQPDDNTIRYGIEGLTADDPWGQALLEFYTNVALNQTTPRGIFGNAEVGADGVNVPLESTNFEVMQQTVFTVGEDGQLLNYDVYDPEADITWQPINTLFQFGASEETVVTFGNPESDEPYSIRGMVTSESGETFDVEWYFNAETGEPEVMWLLLEDPFGTITYSEYKPFAGDMLQLYTYGLEDNQVTVDVSETMYNIGDTDLDEYAVTPSEETDGEYMVVVVVSDVSGQTIDSELEVKVQGGQPAVTFQSGIVIEDDLPNIPASTSSPSSSSSGGTCNPDAANYCNAGNQWGDGRCVSNDPDVTAYNYQLGWYRAAYECGAIDTYPAGFEPQAEPEAGVESTAIPCDMFHPNFPYC